MWARCGRWPSSPTGAVLYSAGVDGRLQRWSLDTGAEVGDPLIARGEVFDAVSTIGRTPPRELVVTTSARGAIVWDLATARTVERDGAVPASWYDEFVAGLVGGVGPLAVVTTNGRMLVADGRQLPAPERVWRGWWVGQAAVFEQRDTARLEGGVSVWATVDGVLDEVATGADAVDAGPCMVAVASGRRVELRDVGRCGAPAGLIDLGGDDDGRGSVVAVALDPIRRRWRWPGAPGCSSWSRWREAGRGPHGRAPSPRW